MKYFINVFRWLLPNFKSHPELSIDKRFPLRDSLQSVHLREHIERCWTNELLASIDTNRKPRFLYAAWRCYGPAYVIVSTCLLIIEFLCALQALLYYYYAFEPRPLFSFALWSVSLLYVVTKHLWKASVCHMGIQLRVSLQTLLLKKVLLIDTENVNFKDLNSQVMEVVRRLSNMDNLFLFTPYIFVAFLYTISVGVLLAEYYRYSTSSILLTMAVLFILIPYQVLLAYRTDTAGKKYIRQNMTLCKILNEYRRSWDEVKAYCLKRTFIESVRKHRLSTRSTELTLYLYETVLFVISLHYTKVVALVFVMAHIWFEEDVPEEKVLLLLAFLEIFMYPLSVNLSRSISLTSEFVKTINSLQDVLMMLDKASPNLEGVRKDTEIVIKMKDVQAGTAPLGKLLCEQLVITRGQTVAFPSKLKPRTKKTLLRLLTGEIDLNDGTASIYGKVSLCSKKAWLFPRASVKKNILSNHFYNSQKYQRVINICDLSHDLQYLPKGENTIIGSKGDHNVDIELAMKISIARVLYRDAEVYIFDSILDLLCAQASNRLLERILKAAIKDNKCIIIFSQRPWLVRQTQRLFNVVYDRIQELDARKEKIESLSDYMETDEEQPEEDVTSGGYFTTGLFTPDFRDVRVDWKVMQNSPMPRSISLADLKAYRKKSVVERKKPSSQKSVTRKLLSAVIHTVGFAMTCSVIIGIIVSSLTMHVISAGWLYICLYQSILPPVIDDPALQVLLGLSIAASILLMVQYYWLVNNFLDTVYDGLISSLFSLKRWQSIERESIIFIMQKLQPKLDTNFTATLIQCLKRWLIYWVSVTMMIVYTPVTVVQGVAMSLCLVYIGKYCSGYVTKLWHLQDELWGIVEKYFKFKDEQILSVRSQESSEKYQSMFYEHMVSLL
uniref:Multidrug resistance-associated protein 4 n=1 Tax=Lygus hesperus TaxID=30085 RepID=A0A0A9WJS8_LYGHE